MSERRDKRTGRIRAGALLASAFLVLCLTATSAADARERLALVVGNSTYSVSALANPVNDARLIADKLKGAGFDVSLVENADRSTMANAVISFGQKLQQAGANAVGLFYFAGHGVQAHGENYLIPIDAKVDLQAQLDFEALSLTSVMRQMAILGNQLYIIVLDACRNNPFDTGFRSANSGLARVSAPTGSIVAYAAAPGQVAVDGSGSHSPYSEALANWITEPGLPIEEVFKRVRRNVTEATSGQQVPWEESSITGDFFFQPPKAADEPGATQQAATPPSDGGVNDKALELAFWDSIKTSDNWRAFQAYLDTYGQNGNFAALARVHRDRLKESETASSEAQGAPEEPATPEIPTPEIPTPKTATPEIATPETEEPETDTTETKTAAVAPNDLGATKSLSIVQKRTETARLPDARQDVEDVTEPEEPELSAAEREERTLLPSANERKRVQRALATLGHYRMAVDGILGEGSRAAIRSFEREAGLPVDGYIDPRARSALFRAESEQLAADAQAREKARQEEDARPEAQAETGAREDSSPAGEKPAARQKTATPEYGKSEQQATVPARQEEVKPEPAKRIDVSEDNSLLVRKIQSMLGGGTRSRIEVVGLEPGEWNGDAIPIRVTYTYNDDTKWNSPRRFGKENIVLRQSGSSFRLSRH